MIPDAGLVPVPASSTPGRRRQREVIVAMREDVAVERRAAMSADPVRTPLVIRDVRKAYDGAPRAALRGLSLAVDGGCFVLLGPNGAGKTTLIGVLTGQIPPTGGEAWLAQHSILQRPDKARLSLGLCPQHNVLWPELTSLETALFWARLKGAPQAGELAAARAALGAVGLAEAEQRLAAELSGGMKRRLCLAAALTSDPAVVFLDEPSAGLDPYSRRQMWDLLDRARAGRLLVLTTHAMDEAELLSTRIGIIAGGRLQCVGAQGDLRKRFGGGYSLSVGYLPGREAQADLAVRKALPEAARLPGHFQGALSYHLPGACSVAEVFSKMESLARDPGGGSGPAAEAAAAAAAAPAPAGEAEDERDIFARGAGGAPSLPAPPPVPPTTAERVIAEWGLSRVGLDEVFRRIVAAATENPRGPGRSSLRRGGNDDGGEQDDGASSSSEEEEIE